MPDEPVEPPAPPPEIYAVFAGPINPDTVQRFIRDFTKAAQNRIKRVHLLLHSEGGIIVEGIFLYHFLKGLGVPITTYNCGSVSSIAVLVYLAGDTRIAAASASFMIHKATNTFTGPVTAENIEITAKEIRDGDAKIEGILRSHLDMPEDKWSAHAVRNLVISAQEATEFALAHKIGNWTVPSEHIIWSI